MIKIKNLFKPNIGDKVIVKSNSSSHTYSIGKEYTIVFENIDGVHYQLLSDEKNDAATNRVTSHGSIPFSANIWTPQNGVQNLEHGWINIQDLMFKVNKEYLVSNLSEILEFLKDYEGDLISFDKVEKEFRVYHILKEIKSTKSDFDKIALISKYL